MELVTQPLIDEYRRIGSEGLDRSRYDALRAAIDQRKVVIGVLVVAGSVSALASGLLFWADAGSIEEPKGGAVGADIRLFEGGAAVEITVGF